MLKDGNSKGAIGTGDIFWTAWLLDVGATAGDWEMGIKSLSHMSLYGTIKEGAVLGCRNIA